jgi:hypothetical protein
VLCFHIVVVYLYQQTLCDVVGLWMLPGIVACLNSLYPDYANVALLS